MPTKKALVFIVSLLVVVFSLRTGQNLQAQEIGKAWEFNENGNFEGIVLDKAFKDSVVENGYLKAVVANLFPSLKSGPFSLEAKDYGYIRIRMKLPGATSAKILWTTDRVPFGFYRFKVTGDSLFHVYDIPVYLSAYWVGKITRIARLDFNPAIGSQVEIDYIRIIRVGQKPTILNLTPLRTILKPNENIPFLAVVQNKGDVGARFSSVLSLPDGASLVSGSTEMENGFLFKDVTDTLRWTILFPDTGDFEVGLKVFSASDTTEKILSLHVTREYWKPKEFLLSAWSPPYAWYGPPFEDSVFAYYKKANFDQILWVRDDQALMEKVHAFGFKYFLMVTPLFGDAYLRGEEDKTPPAITEAMLEKLDTLIDKYKTDPNLLGYHLCDEPHVTAFPNIAKVVARIRKKDPTRLSFVNIWPNVAEDKGSGKYIDQLLQTTKLELLSYDRYPFFNDHDEVPAYFSNLMLIRTYALKYHIPFCNIIQAIGTNGTSQSRLNWRTPSEGEHRFLAYSSLAYGVHGLIWFHWHGDWGVTGSPDREQIYRSLQSLNAEIRRIGPIMLRLTTTGVYHSRPSFGGLKLPGNGIVKAVSDNADLVIGYFKNQNGRNYFMLMNKNYSAPVTFHVTLNGTTDDLKYFHVQSGAWQTVSTDDSTGNSVFPVTLRPGGGKLFSVGNVTNVLGSQTGTFPREWKLRQNYPNPFNPCTTIAYTVPGERTTAGSGTQVMLKIFDVQGREVTTLVDKTQKPGFYRVRWNGRNGRGMQAPSGIYFCSLRGGAIVRTKKMLLLR